VLWVAGAAGVCKAAAARETARWATGAELQKRLNSPVDITWAENPLRHAIGNLSRSQKVAALIDRRVDADQKLDVELEGVTLRAAFEEIARGRGLGVSLLGPVLFLGPPAAASRLRTVAALREEDVRRLPAGVGEKFAALKPMAWDDLATPRELLAALAAENGVELTGLELVPHDLWAAADLPPLSWTDRLTLIAIQFDLTFAISADGTAVRLTALPGRLAVVRSYAGGSDPAATARKFAALAPGAEIKVSAGRVYVRGLVEDQERITQPRRPAHPPKPPARPGLASQRFTLTVKEHRVGPLLEQLARQLKLELTIDRQAIGQAGISLDQRISFSVSDATVDELLQAAAKPAGLRAQRRGSAVEVGPAKP
jgi:hypothetical protein